MVALRWHLGIWYRFTDNNPLDLEKMTPRLGCTFGFTFFLPRFFILILSKNEFNWTHQDWISQFVRFWYGFQGLAGFVYITFSTCSIFYERQWDPFEDLFGFWMQWVQWESFCPQITLFDWNLTGRVNLSLRWFWLLQICTFLVLSLAPKLLRWNVVGLLYSFWWIPMSWLPGLQIYREDPLAAVAGHAR